MTMLRMRIILIRIIFPAPMNCKATSGRIAGARGAVRRRFVRGSLSLLAAAGSHTGAAALGQDAAAAPGRGAVPGRGAAAGDAALAIRTGIAFGTRIRITIAGLAPAAADRAAGAALAEISGIERVASLYLPQSALSRLNATGRLEAPDARLVDLLAAAQDWSSRSGGAFDVSVQPLWDLYAATPGAAPPSQALTSALALVDFRAIEVAPDRIRLALAGARLTLNGIVQGFAADRALAALRAHGAECALVDAGEFAATRRDAAGTPWRIGVRDPLARAPAAVPLLLDASALIDTIALADAAVASSSDQSFRFTADGRAHHIFDPRSGTSPPELAGATVVAADATSADALSTACMVLGVERSLALLAATPGAAALLVRKDGQRVATANWCRQAAGR
ncbi:MAG: FAD:protein FMN transferase [Lautropia sp.]